MGMYAFCDHKNRKQSEQNAIQVKELTWISLYELKEAGQSYDELLTAMARRERDYRLLIIHVSYRPGKERDGIMIIILESYLSYQ